MSNHTVPQREVSTDQAPMHQRLSFWEEHNASELIGLQCTSYANEGLAARERNFDLGAIRLADIAGNAHVIERTSDLVRRQPKDSVFIAVLLEGDAFFYQRGHCLTAQPGDVLIYSTSVPYLCGFGRGARQFLVDMPDELLHQDAARDTAQYALLDRPIKIGGALPGEPLLASELQRLLQGFTLQPLLSQAAHVSKQIQALCRTLLAPYNAVRAGESASIRRLQAEAFIAERLGDHSLDAAAIAQHLCLSVRHLNRLFEPSDSTATQWIWQQRLAAAHRMLTDPAQRFSTIGDIGFRCGFATPSHFTSAFKACYGLTPSRHRQMALAEPVAEPV